MIRKKLLDLLIDKSEMTATADVNGEVHELTMPIGGSKLVYEPLRPMKEHQYFYYCYVTDEFVNDCSYALTVIAKFDLKRYYESQDPQVNEVIQRVEDITAIGLDGNGEPITGWHQRRIIDEVRKDTNDGAFMDRLLGTYRYFEHELKEDHKLNVKSQSINEVIHNEMLVCEQNVNISLEEDFMTYIRDIGAFTREKDVTFPHSVVNEEMAEFDNIRTGIGAISLFIPVGKSYKIAQTFVDYITGAVGVSSLFLPASNYFDLRGPVKLSKVTKNIYINNEGRTLEEKEYDPILKKDVEIPIYELTQSENNNDEIEIYY